MCELLQFDAYIYLIVWHLEKKTYNLELFSFGFVQKETFGRNVKCQIR